MRRVVYYEFLADRDYMTYLNVVVLVLVVVMVVVAVVTVQYVLLPQHQIEVKFILRLLYISRFGLLQKSRACFLASNWVLLHISLIYLHSICSSNYNLNQWMYTFLLKSQDYNMPVPTCSEHPWPHHQGHTIVHNSSILFYIQQSCQKLLTMQLHAENLMQPFCTIVLPIGRAMRPKMYQLACCNIMI